MKLCRHADRNIEQTYPNDPFKLMKYWPGGYGELTNVRIEFVRVHEELFFG